MSTNPQTAANRAGLRGQKNGASSDTPSPGASLLPYVRALRKAPTDKMLATVHYANRLLQRRDLVKDINKGLIVRGVAGEPEDDEAQLAQQLVLRFAEREKTPLQELSNDQADRYVKFLSNIAQNRVRRENPKTAEQESRVSELLEKVKALKF